MYFAVDPDEVGAASVPLSHLANAVANLDLAADLAPLALAMPASSVATSVPELGARWSVWVGGLRDVAGLQAGRLDTASATYAGVEASAGASLSARSAPS